MNREQAEILLTGQDNGVFLVRDSSFFKGLFTLSIINDRKIKHFILTKNNENFLSIDYLNWFESLNDLIIVRL